MEEAIDIKDAQKTARMDTDAQQRHLVREELVLLVWEGDADPDAADKAGAPAAGPSAAGAPAPMCCMAYTAPCEACRACCKSLRSAVSLSRSISLRNVSESWH